MELRVIKVKFSINNIKANHRDCEIEVLEVVKEKNLKIIEIS